MGQQNQAGFAVGNRFMDIGVDDLDKKLVRRRVVVTAAVSALNHPALHLRRPIRNADERIRCAKRFQPGDQIAAQPLRRGFSGHQNHAHRREIRV